VLNLVTNSIQAMAPTHGGSLRIATRAADGNVRLEVTDTGPGIPRQARARVFEPFFTTKGEGEGTGLGLSVSYGIAAAHGGSIVLERTSPAGTTFVVSLPESSDEPIAERVSVDSVQAPPRSAIAGTRVLFVDDEPTLCTGVAAFGKLRGFAVATAADGETALAAVSERSFDAVVCDIRMPGMDGLAFHRALAQARPGLARRTVFITGDVVSAGKRPADAARQPTLVKPFTFERLEEALTAVMRSGR
jgi:CheY-like chemotaxis protein